jgi:hypothetical protein
VPSPSFGRICVPYTYLWGINQAVFYVGTFDINLDVGVVLMQEMLTWLYGRSARNAHIRKMAERAVVLLKKQPLEYMELCRALEIGFDNYQKPRRTFYFVVNPLKRVHLIKERREVIDQDTKKYKTVYFLNPGAFQGYMTRIIDETTDKLKEN